MGIEYRKIGESEQGTLCALLADAYSFDGRLEECWKADWEEFDAFFYGNLQIADRCGFITALDGEAIGFVSWDPRPLPDHVVIGHNCIATRHKGQGYGKLQLREAIDRITLQNPGKIIVTTNTILLPAQRMYESAGFAFRQRRKNHHNPQVIGDFLDYEYRP